MVDPKIVQEWIEKAESDFKFADFALKDTDYYTHICFHFQQAAEKYLKAFIIAKELPFKKTHTIASLIEICREAGYKFDSLAQSANFLDSCYVDTRYPVHWSGNYTREEAQKARDAADEIRETALAALGQRED